jgi:hypothetical protein
LRTSCCHYKLSIAVHFGIIEKLGMDVRVPTCHSCLSSIHLQAKPKTTKSTSQFSKTKEENSKKNTHNLHREREREKMKLENANKTQNPKPQNPLLNSAKPRKKTH